MKNYVKFLIIILNRTGTKYCDDIKLGDRYIVSALHFIAYDCINVVVKTWTRAAQLIKI